VWKTIEHTADAGFEITADSLEVLFLQAAEALYSLCSDESPPPESAGGKTEHFEIDAVDLEELVVSWINELLFFLETRETFFLPTAVRISEEPLSLYAEGVLFRPPKVRIPVKSATYGGLVIRNIPIPFLRIFLDM
jgi:SHS2 domain-containing protein